MFFLKKPSLVADYNGIDNLKNHNIVTKKSDKKENIEIIQQFYTNCALYQLPGYLNSFVSCNQQTNVRLFTQAAL